MQTRRVVISALFASAMVLASCSSGDDGSSDQGEAPPESLDLSGVDVEAVCADLGGTYDVIIGAADNSSDIPAMRAYLAEQMPVAIEHLDAAAAAASGELQTAIEQMSATYQENFEKGQAATDEEFTASLLTPETDPEFDEAIVVVNRFTDPECGFRFTTV